MRRIAFRSTSASLRPAGAADVERLVAWHADPEVSRYWDDETFTRAEMEERLARDDVEAWIVEEGGEPVGYLQVHPDGLDMFLIPDARGRGLGPDAARAMAEHLLDERGRERVTRRPLRVERGRGPRLGARRLRRGLAPRRRRGAHRALDPDGVPRLVRLRIVLGDRVALLRGRAPATRRSPRSGRPREGAYPWPVLS